MTTTAAEIAHHAGGSVIAGTADAVVTSWAFDSRALEPGACFVALHGDRDGHDFVAGAFSAGATVALVAHPIAGVNAPDAGAIVQVDDVLAGLQELARASRVARPELSVVAVTGSTGKTSTKDLLAAVLAPLGSSASVESFNNEFGLPITLLNTPADAHVLVAEMGERYPGDIAHLCAIAKPDIGVVTNVGLAHAEHLGGQAGAAKAMGEMLASLPAGGLAVLNADDEWTRTLEAPDGVEVATVGTAASADYRIEGVTLDDHLHPTFSLNGQRVTVPLHGHHHASNAGLALAVAHRGFDIDLAAAAAGLAGVRPARWRLELRVTMGGVTVLNDAYNANPASMHAALRVLGHTATTGRRIAILGDMLELGVHSDEAHAGVGRQAAESRVDVLIGVGDGGRVIAEAAGAAVPPVPEVRVASDAEGALRIAQDLATRGDTILVKASRAVGLEVVATLLEGAS
jgi:UDP-N-acetylmuramoyl-tripeptide--D-alanyl-D-alanine ligase